MQPSRLYGGHGLHAPVVPWPQPYHEHPMLGLQGERGTVSIRCMQRPYVGPATLCYLMVSYACYVMLTDILRRQQEEICICTGVEVDDVSACPIRTLRDCTVARQLSSAFEIYVCFAELISVQDLYEIR
jgi:hypothetical protein